MTDKLIIDPKGQYEPKEGFHIDPSQMGWLKKVEKNSFDMVIIKNTESSQITQKHLSSIRKVLKPNCICEVYVSQLISVLQDLDAKEIESNAKLAKFASVESSIFEKFLNENGRDVKYSTIRLTLVTSD